MKVFPRSPYAVPPRPPPNGPLRRPRASYWGDPSPASQPTRLAPQAPASEKSLTDKAPAPTPPEALPRRRIRLAFPLFVGVALAPVVACTVLPALVMTGVMAALPAVLVGMGVFAMTVLGTAIVKWLEDWESAAP